MKAGPLLCAENVFIIPEGVTKWHTLQFMVYGSPRLDNCDRRAIVENLDRQESALSSGIADGFAIPHCEQPGIQNTVFLFGFSKAGVPWGSYDSLPAHFVFLVVRPVGIKEDYFRIYSSVAELMKRNCHQEMLATFACAHSPSEVLDYFLEIEGT